MARSAPIQRADRQIALLLFALVAALYLRMAAPDLLGGDPGEFQFAAWTFGLAHATGYPLYLLLGGTWQHLLALVGMEPARALNLLSGILGAGAVTALYFLLRRWLTGPVVLTRAAALLAAVLFAVNPTFWSQSLIAEVYALHALLVVLILLAAQSIGLASGTGVATAREYLLLFFLIGLGLTHHGMTLLLLPGLLLYLQIVDRGWWRQGGRTLLLLAVLALPLLLYFYIPLRSGPAASPWYHQPLGDGTLTLYAGTPRAFFDFVTGKSISVGFLAPGAALGRLRQAGLLWRLHYNWPGLVLAVAGLIILFWQRRRDVLALTLTYVVLQQLFNLFYAIDDILVYYIPLYLMASIWIGFAAEMLVVGVDGGLTAADSPKPERVATAETRPESADVHPAGAPHDSSLADADTRTEPDAASRMQQQAFSLIVILVLAIVPWRIFNSYQSVLDQSDARGARTMWEEILAASPPSDAILVSNDRNEIVPLFYLQTVEGRGQGMTGLFPLIEPGTRFADVGAAIATALDEGGTQPVVLVKPMPGLEVRFDLAEPVGPLVEVMGPAVVAPPVVVVDAPYGPLRLAGYDWTARGEAVEITLHWLVEDAVGGDYTTSVQLFAADGTKLAQDDAAPGGVYYPTSLWKPGEELLDRHMLPLPDGVVPVELLVNLYSSGDLQSLAEPLRLPLE